MTFADLGIEERGGVLRYTTTCPWCSHLRKKKNDPCLSVNNEPDNRWYKCHHCGESGNLDIMDKYDKVRENSRMPREIDQIKSYSIKFTEYLKKRGLIPQYFLREKVYEFINARKETVIGFPFYIGHTLVNVKFFLLESTSKKRWYQLGQKYGTKSCFLGLATLQINMENDRKEKNIAIITEGEWDFFTWKQCGYRNVLSPPMGAPDPKAKNFHKEFDYAHDTYFQSIAKYIDLFYLATDMDAAGILLRDNLAKIVGKDKCKVVKYPKGYKDINEVLNGKDKEPAMGKKGVIECFENANFYPIKGIIKPSDVKFELQRIREKGFEPGFGIGIPEVDYFFTLKRQHISFWTGIPNMGKSVWLRWYITAFIKHNIELGLKWAVFPPENRPVEREIAKIAQVLTGQDITELDDETYNTTMNWIEQNIFIISPDMYNFEDFEGVIKKGKENSLQSILKYVSFLCKTENIFGYLIDAWNKVEHDIPRQQTMTSYISSQLDYILDFNKAHDVHGMIVAHPTKLSISKTTGYYEMPVIYDIADSRAWNEKADIGGVIHRRLFRKMSAAEKEALGDEDIEVVPRHFAPLNIKIEKLRFEELGERGVFRMVQTKTGGFEIYAKDKDIHIRMEKAKGEEMIEEKVPDSIQQELPELFGDTDETLPF